MSEKLRVLERGTDMVLAAHITDVGHGRRTTTIETVRFDRPERVHFRLVRGPVPDVTETFELTPGDHGGTYFVYECTLATDFWMVGERWGKLVARKWESAVRASLDAIKSESERRANTASRTRANLRSE